MEARRIKENELQRQKDEEEKENRVCYDLLLWCVSELYVVSA